MAKVSHSNPALDDVLQNDADLPDAPAQHTPGPWTSEYDPCNDGTDYHHIFSGPNRMDAANYNGGLSLSGTLSKANARLIAAAPELLEALKRIMGPDGDMLGASEQAFAAIAKAEGRA